MVERYGKTSCMSRSFYYNLLCQEGDRVLHFLFSLPNPGAVADGIVGIGKHPFVFF